MPASMAVLVRIEGMATPGAAPWSDAPAEGAVDAAAGAASAGGCEAVVCADVMERSSQKAVRQRKTGQGFFIR